MVAKRTGWRYAQPWQVIAENIIEISGMALFAGLVQGGDSNADVGEIHPSETD